MARSDGGWSDRIKAARRRGKFDSEDLADAEGYEDRVSPISEVSNAVGQGIRCRSQADLYFEGRLYRIARDMRLAVKAGDFGDAEMMLERMRWQAQKGRS